MRFWQVFKKNSFYYLLFLPVALYLIVFKYIPMIGLVISFKDVKPYMYVFEKLAAPFVDFKHFILFFHSFFFWDVMENTIMISLYKTMWAFPAPILLALLINEVRNV